ncbi:helix-turn-helix domain-containing protein [Amycolatopsis sp. NPDC005232]|uniref:sigma-54-dependent Fis family transcriptional regulator n=1 Tax=Amycolatopsis sp. NPDC005232 TaxID=3157027 RepID=UPI0033A0E603
MKTLRPEIERSWHRSALSGLKPGEHIDTSRATTVDRESRLLQAARPVLDSISAQLAGTRYAIMLADRNGRLVDLRAGISHIRDRLEAVGAVPGNAYSEATSGTNSIAAVFETGTGFAVHGAEHYLEVLKPYSCYGAPISGNLTRRREGVLCITCLAEDDNELLAAVAGRAARDIEVRLHDTVRFTHRRSLAAFEAAAVRTRGPLLVLGPDLLIANDSASDLLVPADHAALQVLSRECGRGSAAGAVALTLTSDLQVAATFEEIPDSGGAVLVTLDRPDRRRVVPRRRGASAVGPWRASVGRELDRHRGCDTPVLIEGEPGTGRSSAARHLAGANAICALDGIGDIVRAEVDGHSVTDVLLVDDAHLLVPASATRVRRLLGRPGLRVVMTSSPGLPPSGEVAALLASCPVRISLPSLREQREHIPAVAAAMLRDHPATTAHFDGSALRALVAHEWPGNLRELSAVVDYVARRRSAGDIAVEDLPPQYRAGSQPVQGALWQAERDAIARALALCGGNKVRAAEVLGISRTMLYRRIRVFGLDAGSWAVAEPGVSNKHT